MIPVLVHGARMPSQEQLPESLKSFSHRNSVELSHARWPSDVKLLIEALKQLRRSQQNKRAGAGPRHRSRTTPPTASACDSCPGVRQEVESSMDSWYRGPGGGGGSGSHRPFHASRCAITLDRRHMEKRRWWWSRGRYHSLPGDLRFREQPFHARLWVVSARSLRLGYPASRGRRTSSHSHLPSHRSSRFSRYQSSRVGARYPRRRQSRCAGPEHLYRAGHQLPNQPGPPHLCAWPLSGRENSASRQESAS